MKKWLWMGCLFLVLLACSKYTTPRKVERRLTAEGTWKISSFTIDGTSVTGNYATYTFSFGKEGDASVKGGITATGTWSVGAEKDPAILYLNFPPVGGLEYVTDDWIVTKVKKNSISLQRNESLTSGSFLVFSK